MRRGNHLLLSLAGYFIPIASIAVAAAYLRVVPGVSLIVGCVLVTGGALVCKYSLADETGPEGPQRRRKNGETDSRLT